jgi:hypothetical protein
MTDNNDEKTGIDWLDVAIAIANIIVAHIILEIESKKDTEDWPSLVRR